MGVLSGVDFDKKGFFHSLWGISSSQMGVFLKILLPQADFFQWGEQVKLTDSAVKNAKPKPKPYKLFDGGGMFLLTTPNGGKCWRLKYRFEGKEKLLALGIYPDVSLKDARRRRDEAREALAGGIDPSVIKREAKAVEQDEQRKQANTFAAVALQWLDMKKAEYSEDHHKKLLSRLENKLFPLIGGIPMPELTADHIFTAIQPEVDKGNIETAKRLTYLCNQVCRYARLRGYVLYNVADGIGEALPVVAVQHYAALTNPKDISALLQAIDEYNGSYSIVYALKLMPLVFLRSTSLRGGEWSEIDWEERIWRVPAWRMKGKKREKSESAPPFLVPLPAQAMKMLRELHEFSGDGKYMFPSLHSKGKFVSDGGLLTALRRMGFSQGEMTIHGFRTTASTLLNEQGYRPDVVEVQLAHKEKNAVRAAYNRAEYMDERRQLLQDWADYLDALKSGKVIPFPQKKAGNYA